MYEELNCFEEALKHFGTRVEVICAMAVSYTHLTLPTILRV